MGIKALRKLQLGREASTDPGTAVNATTVWRGLGTIEDQREVVFPVEDVGYLSGLDRTYTPRMLAALAMDRTEATFEQVNHIFEAGIRLVGTGTSDGAGSDFIYTYTIPTTSAPSIATYTVEGGDNQQEEEFTYGHVVDFELSGNAGEAWMVAANWQGRQVAAGTYTPSTDVTIPAVDECLFGQTRLYIDNDSDTIGTTQVSNTLFNAVLRYDTGQQAQFTADGNLYFTFVKYTMPEILLDLTFEHNASAVAEIAAWRNETARLIQLNCTGPALGTPGTTYSNKKLIINLAGKWESFTKLDERDGNDIVTGTFRARYNATYASAGNIIVVNELGTVP